MKKILLPLITAIILLGCNTSRQITDPESYELQKEIRRSRTGLNFAEAGLYFGSAVLSAATGVDIGTEASNKRFRKMLIENSSTDTLIVNMVTDIQWKEDQYCDIRGIVIPPLEEVKVIAPIETNYNVYFRRSFAEEDELIEINTSGKRKLKLMPGMTILPEQ